jgi:AbrB family looped-hinge helix DNA binding protein
MTVTVGPKGQVVIPKELRDRLGIRPGDRVDFSWETDCLVLRMARPVRPLEGRFAGLDLQGDLLRERAAERK